MYYIYHSPIVDQSTYQLSVMSVYLSSVIYLSSNCPVTHGRMKPARLRGSPGAGLPGAPPAPREPGGGRHALCRRHAGDAVTGAGPWAARRCHRVTVASVPDPSTSPGPHRVPGAAGPGSSGVGAAWPGKCWPAPTSAFTGNVAVTHLARGFLRGARKVMFSGGRKPRWVSRAPRGWLGGRMRRWPLTQPWRRGHHAAAEIVSMGRKSPSQQRKRRDRPGVTAPPAAAS